MALSNMKWQDLLMHVGIPLAGDLIGQGMQNRNVQNAANAQQQSNTEAANINRQAGQDALRLQERMYQEGNNRMEPWRASGEAALGNLNRYMGVKPNPQAPQTGSMFGQSMGNGLSGIQNFNPQQGQPQQQQGPGMGSQLLSTGLSLAPMALGALRGGGAAGAVGGAGLGKLAAFATNPVTLAGAGVAAGVGAWLKSQAHHEANSFGKVENAFTSSFLAPFVSSYDQLKASGQLTPETAQQYLQRLDQEEQAYRQNANQYATRGSDEKKVAGQSVNNLGQHINNERQKIMRDLQGFGGR